MSNIFPIDFEEKNTICNNDFILFSDSQDGNKLKKAQYSNLKGEKWDTWTAATVSVGSTTTLPAWSSACVTNSWTTSAAVFNFSIPKGDKGDTWQTWPAIVNAEFNWNDIDFTEEDGNVVTLTDAKLCLKWDKGDTWCTWATWPSICAAAFNWNNIDFTETNWCVVTLTDAKTCLKGDTWATWPWATVSIWTTTTLDAWCCATVTNSWTCEAAVFNFGIPKWDKWDTWATWCTWPAWNWIACVTSTKAWKITTVDITCTDGCSYCFQVSDGEDGQWSWDMLKCVYDPNSHEADAFDYCNFTNTPTIPTDNCQLANGCWYTTCTGTLTSSNISNVIYGSSWSGVVTDAPSKKVMYDKLKTYDAIIPSAATCSNQLTDKNYVDDSINSVTAYYITKNAQGDQFACYAELAAATTFYSWWVQRTPTRNDYTIVADDECYSDATTRYIYNSGWEYQYTVNETPLTTAQLNALNSWITAAKVSCYDAIPVITNNCQIANGCWYTTCTWTVSTCADVISALWYTPYNSSNPSWYTTCTWTLSPTNTWTNWQVLTKTSWWAARCDSTWWIVNDTTCTTSTIEWLWAGTEWEYWCIWTKCWTTLYFLF